MKETKMRKEIMDIVNLLIEEKKIVDKIDTYNTTKEEHYKKLRELDKNIEVGNIKAYKFHKQNLDNAGKLIISEKMK